MAARYFRSPQDSSWCSTRDPRRNLLILPLRLRVVRMQSPRHKSALFPYFGADGRREDGASSPVAVRRRVFRRAAGPECARHGAGRSNVIDRAVMFVDRVGPRRLDTPAGMQFPSTRRLRPVKECWTCAVADLPSRPAPL